MSKLSLCMIACNEEERIAEALESVREIADEMIVVDTGSTDRTIEIAKSCGARVESFEWIDDFSAARNFSLDLATSDWIFQLDADETLEEEDIPNVLEAIKRDDLDAVYVAIHNNEQGANGRPKMVVHPYPRLFRRNPETRYQGIVHEFISNLNATTFDICIRIYHDGYACSIEEQAERRQRNENLCLKQLERDPNNPVAHFNLAGVYLCEKRIDDAQKHLETALQHISPDDNHYQHFYLMALHYLAAIYGTKGETDRAIDYCNKALEVRKDYLDPYFLLGELNFQQGNLQNAEFAFRCFLEVREQLSKRPARALFSQSRFNSHDHVHLRLGSLYQDNGLEDLAEQHYQQAIEANPNSIDANVQVARFYTKKMDINKAKHYLAAAQRLQETAKEAN